MEDNYSLWKAHDDELEEEASKLPICPLCADRIYDEKCYEYKNEQYHKSCVLEDTELLTELLKDFEYNTERI